MEYRDVIVAKVGDLQNGEMKQVSVDGGEILLVNIDGKLSALGAYCTHYGAELATGTLIGERIVCPWHQACFCGKSGEVAEPPALDALPRYEVTVRDDDVIVRLPTELPKSREHRHVSYDPAKDSRTFVILGAGAAGNSAAQTLRQEGYTGRLIMISSETALPYDRPNLDKAYLEGSAPQDWLPLRSEQFYDQYGIERRCGKAIIEVDISRKTLVCEDQTTLTYDKLLLATGGIPRVLALPGSDLPNVFTLRSLNDANLLIHNCEYVSRVVVIGASFLGMESAFSLRQRGLDVTVIAPEEAPFNGTFGREIGRMIQHRHESHGIHFKLGRHIERFEGKHRAETVVLDSGEQIQTELVLLGIGVMPNTGYLEGIDLEADGSVRIDESFQAAPDVYAAGDIARFPDWRCGEGIRIEHWRTAEQHGRDAARNMIGSPVVVSESVPFFWTKQADVNLRYVGHARQWDEIIFDGDLSTPRFLALYCKKNQVYAALGCQRDKEMGAIHELMRRKPMAPLTDYERILSIF